MSEPKLVDLTKFKNVNVNGNVISIVKKKWNLNKILLIGFTIFTIFFLYNCKYGFFKSNRQNAVNNFPLAYI